MENLLPFENIEKKKKKKKKKNANHRFFFFESTKLALHQGGGLKSKIFKNVNLRSKLSDNKGGARKKRKGKSNEKTKIKKK